jgi:adenine deaminase
MDNLQISGNVIDLIAEKIFPATVYIEKGKIAKIEKSRKIYKNYILPGFVDSHVHIESSMLPPSEFARLASIHGTVATVSDPHEIANVLGLKGVEFMIKNAQTIPFKIYFGVPSCVPATDFESSGAKIGIEEIKILFNKFGLKYLSEMMNYPGVLLSFPDVMEKINLAKQLNKPIDGHAPGLKGKDAEIYVKAGISTDHECYSLEEAINKIKAGMKVLIREGSAAKNFEILAPLIDEYPEMCMFCTDDAHPDHLTEMHIRDVVLRAFDLGYDVMNVLKIASLNPIKHYNLDVGLLQIGDPADFIVINNFQEFKITQTFVNGILIAENGETKIPHKKVRPINNFNVNLKIPDDFNLIPKNKTLPVIKPIDGELITEKLEYQPKLKNSDVQTNLEQDILKITVVNRYQDAKPAIALINGFGLKKGALATSVGHDSHNIIAVGVDNESLAIAVNDVFKSKGGMVVYDGNTSKILPLPIAGLMANVDAWDVAIKYKEIQQDAKKLGCPFVAPFMTLSFMALLVIPKIKLSDKGLFDGELFKFIEQ